jgi:hypothetical protein
MKGGRGMAGTINIWNRIAVGSRTQQPVDHPAKAA